MGVRRVVTKAGRALLAVALAWAASGEAQAIPLAGTWILEVEDILTEGPFPPELVPEIGEQISIQYVVDSEGDSIPSPDVGAYDPTPDFLLEFPAGQIELDMRLVIDNSVGTSGYEINVFGWDRVALDSFIPNPPYPFVEFSVSGLLVDSSITLSQGDAIPRGELDLSRFDLQSGVVNVLVGTDQGLEEGEPDRFLSFRARPIFVAHIPEPGLSALLAVALLIGLRRNPTEQGRRWNATPPPSARRT